MPSDLKQELIDKISATDDENLLLLLKMDYEYFTRDNNRYVTDELSEEDENELINMMNEHIGNDTVSQQELEEAIRQWRMK